MTGKKRFDPLIRAMYGISPSVEPNIEPIKFRDEIQDQKTNHRHPEIEKKLEKIENMLAELLGKSK